MRYIRQKFRFRQKKIRFQYRWRYWYFRPIPLTDTEFWSLTSLLSTKSQNKEVPRWGVSKGTYINDVPRFLSFFDLPTYLCPIWSLLEKAAYLMTSFFVWPTLPIFLYLTQQLKLLEFVCRSIYLEKGSLVGNMYSEGIKYLLRA